MTKAEEVTELLKSFTNKDFNELYRKSDRFREICRSMRIIGQKKALNARGSNYDRRRIY